MAQKGGKVAPRPEPAPGAASPKGFPFRRTYPCRCRPRKARPSSNVAVTFQRTKTKNKSRVKAEEGARPRAVGVASLGFRQRAPGGRGGGGAHTVPFPGGRPFPGYKQSVTNRNAPTVSSSPPASSERLCFFTSLSERLRMLLPPPPPQPLFGRLTLSSLRDAALFSLRLKEVPGSSLSREAHPSPPPRGSGRPSQPRPAPLGQPAHSSRRRQVPGSSPPVPGRKGERR